MALRLYRGTLDSDMTDVCIEEIRNDADSAHLVIIPEHYSYEMERRMVDSFGVIGLNDIEVLTPHRMAVNLLMTDTARYLNPAGKQMLVVCAVNSCIENGDIPESVHRIMRSRSFADNMVTLISEFKRHMIAPSMLYGCAERGRGARSTMHLADKLEAAARVYELYNELLEQKSYVDMDDDVSRLADKIEKDAPLYKNTRVWFMCFDEYLPHHMKLLRAAVKISKETTVCLNYVKADDDCGCAGENGGFAELFDGEEKRRAAEAANAVYARYDLYVRDEPNKQTDNIRRDAAIYSFAESSYKRIKAEGLSEEKFFPCNNAVSRRADIDFLVKHFGHPDRYGGAADDISVIECDDPHREMEYAAEVIHTLVRESEQRYERVMKRCDEDADQDMYGADMISAEGEVRALLEKLLEEKGESAQRADELRRELSIGVPRRPQSSDLIRYRDIGILFGGASDYSHILDAVFTEHDIRYYADDRLLLSEHPMAVQLLSVFDISQTNWSYAAMFRYLNAGFIFDKYGKRLDSGETARLDNYVVRYDIRGRNAWQSKWDYNGEIFAMTWEDAKRDAQADAENEIVNALRARIAAPVAKLLPEDPSEKRSAAEYVKRLYAFLKDIFMYEGLAADVRSFEKDGDMQTAQQFGQIWNKLLEVINQISVTMGDMDISFEEFGEYLSAGLSKCEITTIPSSLDAVYTGTVERSTSKPVKKLFIMGAVSGTYPSAAVYDGFFTDIDRSRIRDYEGGVLELAPEKAQQRIKQRYKVFKAVRTATQSISVTYPASDSEGGSLRTSLFVADITDMFGASPKRAFPRDPADEENITSVYAAKRGLVVNCAAPVNRLDPVWRSVYRCLRDDGGQESALDQIALAASFYSRPPRILPETAQSLYTRRIERAGEYVGMGRVYSATNLDAYASCPMQYFMQFGLRLAEDVKEGVQANEIGTYVHKLVQTVCDDVYTYDEALSEEQNEIKCSESWKNMDEKSLESRIDQCIERTKERLASAADQELRSSIMDRISSAVKRGSGNVLRSLKQGKFTLKASELRIDNVRLMPDSDIYIKGFVDRVDEYKYDDGERRENLLRIIDYKTGNTNFSSSGIQNGKNMQLAVYAIAAAMQFEEKNGEIYSLSGIYYQHMRDRYSRAGDFGAQADLGMYLDGETYLPSKKTDPERRKKILEAINEEKDSLYIGLSDTLGGNRGKRAKTEEDRDKLIGKVRENIRGIDREIMSGRIAPRPYSSGSGSSCDRCRFKDVCSFEGSKSKRYGGAAGASFGGEE